MVKRKRILTSNRELYIQLNNLNFVNQVVLNNVKETYIKKILKNINNENNIIDLEVVNDKIILTKNQKIFFNIYLKT